jgi:hypothetical protein
MENKAKDSHIKELTDRVAVFKRRALEQEQEIERLKSKLSSDSNLVSANFGVNHSILVDLERDILAVAEKYSGQIPLASFIGVLEIVKSGYLNE